MQCFTKIIKIQVYFENTCPILDKGMFLSEDTDVFIITYYRRTFFFPETENLNFGDLKLLRN